MKPVVLHLIDSFNEGGSERQALQLIRLLHDSDSFQIKLASLTSDGVLRTEVEDLNLGSIPSFPLTSFHDRNTFVQVRRFVSFLKSEKVDLLHTHDFYTNIFGILAGKLAGVPVRIASMRETAGMRTAKQTRAQSFAYAFAHHVIANSEAVRQRLVQKGVRADRITVIYNGLDMNRLRTQFERAEALTQLGLPAEEKGARQEFVTIIANMRHEVKDYPMFLRTARRVRTEVPEAAFLLAGEGELTESIRGLVRELGIERSTFFLRRCEKIAELLNISDVCVLSSKAEGFSNSILEYMAAARPVVATDVGGAAEAIIEGVTGYLVRSGDDKTMAEKIISLLRDPERAHAMGRQGRQVVEERFSCAAQLERTEQLYDKLLRAPTAVARQGKRNS